MSYPSLILFSKAPDSIHAKTRIQKREEISHDKVLALHSAMVVDSLELLWTFKDSPTYIFWDQEFDHSSSPFLKEVLEREYIQQGDSFGKRFQNALNATFKQRPESGVIIIGSDCPILTREILEEAMHAVENGKAAIGPAQSEGFYLLAVPSNLSEVDLTNCFQNNEERSEVIRALGGEVHQLPFLSDIDEYEDLISLAAYPPEQILPATRECLKTILPAERSAVHLIIPARNEEQNLPHVLAELRDSSVPLSSLLVVDNASADNTAAVGKAFGATVLQESQLGYGSACLQGIDHLREIVAKSENTNHIVAFLDADLSDYPEDLGKVLTPIIMKHADFVVGSRLRLGEAKKAVPLISRFGNTFAAWIIYLTYWKSFTDLGPMRAITWEALDKIGMADKTWGWTLEMQLKSCQHGISTQEVPVRYRKRYSGKSQISGSLVGATKAATKILWVLFRHIIFDRLQWRQSQRKALDHSPVQ